MLILFPLKMSKDISSGSVEPVHSLCPTIEAGSLDNNFPMGCGFCGVPTAAQFTEAINREIVPMRLGMILL